MQQYIEIETCIYIHTYRREI